MDINEHEAAFKINKMVESFRHLCCCEQCLNSSCAPSTPRRFTNFSMTQLLKPSVSNWLQSAYDSDGTYWTENSDISSSCDEFDTCSNPETSPSRSPEPSDLPLDLSVKHSVVEEANTENSRMLFSRRFRLPVEEDGYSSSDSEVAHALDLRIQRKRTPPKQTSGIPAWVFCTRYTDRPSAGPRARRRRTGVRKPRTRTAFNDYQLEQLNIEFDNDQYLSESRRHRLANELNLNETNVKIWFQNRRAKLKKLGEPRLLALQLQSEGLYNHHSLTE